MYVDPEAEQRKRYGTAAVQGIARHREGRDATVARLRALVAGLRKRWNARPRLALVGVAAELGAYLEAAAKRLPSRAKVSVIDAAAVDAVERARGCDLRVVLVGGRTGGGDALRALCDEGARALKLAKVDPDEIPEEEFAALKPLRRTIEARDGFASEDEAAARVQVLFAEWEKEWVTVATGAGASLEAWERAWLLARHTKWKTGAHEGLREASRGRTIERARLYVPLRAMTTETEFVDGAGQLIVREHTTVREDALAARALRLEKEAQGGPWLEALVTHAAVPNVVVEAPAGAGKTVLLQHIACALTSMHLGEPAEAGEIDVEAVAAGAPLLRVPLLVEARRLAEGVVHGTLGELLNALARELSEHGGHTVDAAAVRDGLAAGRYLLLIDSLDEVPGMVGRAAVLQALDALLAQGWRSRVVLTTRPTAHTGLTMGPRFRLVRIAPLDDDRAAALIGRWADAMGEDGAYRRDAKAALRELRARQGGDAEGGIVANPLLLTCTLLVYDQERLLPDSLADLYERLVEILCRAKATPGYTYDAKRELLERVCEATQRAGGTALEVREAAEVLLRAARARHGGQGDRPARRARRGHRAAALRDGPGTKRSPRSARGAAVASELSGVPRGAEVGGGPGGGGRGDRSVAGGRGPRRVRPRVGERARVSRGRLRQPGHRARTRLRRAPHRARDARGRGAPGAAARAGGARGGRVR